MMGTIGGGEGSHVVLYEMGKDACTSFIFVSL